MKILLILLLTIPPRFALAEVCGPQNYDSETEPNFDCLGPGEAELRGSFGAPDSVPVDRGDQITAPWDGALVHRDRMIQLGLHLKVLRRLRWADSLRIRTEYEIILEAESQIYSARLRYAEQQVETYRERANQAISQENRARSWWRSPVLWFAIGVLTAGGLTALAAYGLSAVGG